MASIAPPSRMGWRGPAVPRSDFYAPAFSSASIRGNRAGPLASWVPGSKPPPSEHLGQGLIPEIRPQAQLLAHFQGAAGHNRLEQVHKAQSFQQVIQDRIQPAGSLRLLGQFPGSRSHNVAVEEADYLPQMRRARPNSMAGNRRRKSAAMAWTELTTSWSWVAASPGAGTMPCRYLNAIPRLRLKRLPRSLARSELKRPHRASSEKEESYPEDHLPHQEIAEAGQAVFAHQGKRLHHVAQGLGHLGVLHQPIAVDVQCWKGSSPWP